MEIKMKHYITPREICKYLKEHHTGLRPQIAEALGIDQSLLESPMRKLLFLNMVKETRELRYHNGPRPCKVYVLGEVPYSESIYRKSSGRPKTAEMGCRLMQDINNSLSLLESIMRSMVVQDADAECEKNVHTRRRLHDGRPGSGFSGPSGSDMGERLQRDEGFIPGGAKTLPRSRS